MRIERLIFTPIMMLLLLFSGGCGDEMPYNEWEYQMNLVTFRAFPEALFVLDNGVELIPENQTSALPLLPDNGRMLLLYEYADIAEGNEDRRKIKINSYARTYCDTISSVSQQELDVMADDPIFLTSIWQEGRFINIRLSIDVNKDSHTVDMFCIPEISNDTLKLELRHDKKGDVPGCLYSEYFSYDIEKYKINYRAFSVKMNTSNYGTKTYVFSLE